MKFVFLLVVVVSFAMLSCNNNTDSGTAADKKDTATAMAKPTESKQERNKKIVMASVEALNTHNLDAMLKDAAPDALDYGSGEKPIKGVDTIKKMIGEWFAAFPDAKLDNPVYVADGDWVFVWATQTGTFKNDMGKVKATGKSYKYQDIDIFKLSDDGKILEHRNIQPQSTMMMQIMPGKK